MATSFTIDENPLREFILSGYHEKRSESEKSRRAIDAVRQFLSGPPGGETVVASYWFERDPTASIASFLEDLDATDERLAASLFEPLIGAVEEMESKDRLQLAPNLSVYVSSLSGACAVKAELDETVASAVVSAAILGLSRLGRRPFETALERRRSH